MSSTSLTVSNIDLFTRQNLIDPSTAYRRLRDIGAAVMLRREKVVAITRFIDVRGALPDGKVFSSAQGVTLNRITNKLQACTRIASDDPLHRQLRNIVPKPLLPAAVRALTEQIEGEADRLVDWLVAQRSFDAIQDLARAPAGRRRSGRLDPRAQAHLAQPQGAPHGQARHRRSGGVNSAVRQPSTHRPFHTLNNGQDPLNYAQIAELMTQVRSEKITFEDSKDAVIDEYLDSYDPIFP